jgi:hypothetical protein
VQVHAVTARAKVALRREAQRQLIEKLMNMT